MAGYAVSDDGQSSDVVRFALGKSGALYVIVPPTEENFASPGEYMGYCVIGSEKVRAGEYRGVPPERILPSGNRLLILT